MKQKEQIVFKSLLSAFVLLGIGATSSFSSNPSIEKIDQEGAETFFYNKGYRNGYADGQKKGFEQGLKTAKKALAKYKKKIEALEAGKYLSKKHKITPPRVYQKKNPDGTVSVVVGGCAIERQLSPQEILMLPEIDTFTDGGVSVSRAHTSPAYGGQGGGAAMPSDSVFLPGVDGTKSETPSLGGSDIRVVYKFFPDTQFYRKLFRASSRPFSIAGGDRIKVIFPSEREAEAFCRRHNLKPGRDVF